MKFIESLSAILDVPIRSGNLRKYAGILDREGRVTRKVQLDLILALCDKVIEIEEKLDVPQPVAVHVDPATFAPIPPLTSPSREREAELKLKRQANIKKAQEARRKKYELKRANSQQNA